MYRSHCRAQPVPTSHSHSAAAPKLCSHGHVFSHWSVPPVQHDRVILEGLEKSVVTEYQDQALTESLSRFAQTRCLTERLLVLERESQYLSVVRPRLRCVPLALIVRQPDAPQQLRWQLEQDH